MPRQRPIPKTIFARSAASESFGDFAKNKYAPAGRSITTFGVSGVLSLYAIFLFLLLIFL
jgi:hypothetical protein